MSGIYKLQGSLQHYVWGGKSYIPQLLAFAPAENQYYAEWWLGAHSSAPSQLEIAGELVNLDQFLAQNPAALGEQSLRQFGQELPFLFKILDVEKPLSIQLHPTKQQAEIGFAEENARGVDLKDPRRTYKDNNHKPEMMIALSDFWLLHGFRTKADMLKTLQARPSLADLAQKIAQRPLAECYQQIMQAEQAQLEAWILPIIASNQEAFEANALSLDNPDYWLIYSMQAMQIAPNKLDAGLLCFYLFNIVYVPEGAGIYQDAGIPHAYLRGQNIELMACSDNVIRGGLTPKHIDIQELLKVIDYRAVEPKLIAPAPAQAKFTYPTPAKDFALERFSYAQGDQLQSQSASASILFVMQGQIKISQKNSALSEEICLTQGQAVFISADCLCEFEALQAGYAVLAKLP